MSALQDVIDQLQSTIGRASPHRRETLLNVFTDEFLGAQRVLSDAHVSVYDEVIYNLSCDIEFRARVQLAHRLADVEKAPYKTIRDLALDGHEAVAGPIIERSPGLKETDLLTIAGQKGQEHLMALSRRRNLTEMVTDILVRRGERPVQCSVVGNSTARLSPNTMLTVMAIAETDRDMRNALENRDALAKAEIEVVIAKARELAVRNVAEDVGHDHAESLVRTGIATIERSGATFSLMGDLGTSEQRVLDWSRQRKLGPADVIALLKAGKLDDGAAMLAHLAMLPTVHVVSVLSAARIDPLLIVLKLAHFDWKGMLDMLAIKVGGEVPPAMIKDAKRLHDDLSATTADRALRFIALRKGTNWG